MQFERVLSRGQYSTTTTICMCLVDMQGLLRELYKVQGHSSSGVTEWDWSKFETQPGLSGVGENVREVEKGGEPSQVPDLGQALPTDSKTTPKMNVRRFYVLR